MKDGIGMQGLMIVSRVTYWIYVKVPVVVCALIDLTSSFSL